jgi:hypothetical protein
MEIGDLVVHIGAKPNGYRVKLVCDIKPDSRDPSHPPVSKIDGTPREVIFFIDGRYDWKDQWRVFNGWKGN